MASRPSLVTLPTEILEAIFLHLDPRSLVAVSQTSKYIRETTDAPVIWRHLCRTQFRTWATHHDITSKFTGPLSQVDWRALFVRRIAAGKDILRLLGKALESQHYRSQHINEIAEFGYDAKETLLEECTCPDDADDVLARRYYANAALERIQREMAIRLWKGLVKGKDTPIEKALGAYDIFTRAGMDVDLDVISADLDCLAQKVLVEYPMFKEQSTRIQASTLASFLRDQGFQGASEERYRALGNSFIGLVLGSPGHESLPLIMVAIYCSLASRLGLDARPCGFVFHVYSIVYAPKDHTLDGKYKPRTSQELEHMYMDPFRSSAEVPQSELQHTLQHMGVPSSQHAGFLSHASTQDMVLRTARNIANSVQTTRQGQAGFHPTWADAYPDMDNAFYASIWAILLLEPEHGGAGATAQSRQALPYLLEHFQNHYPWDVTLIEEHVLPAFRDMPDSARLTAFVEMMHAMDRRRLPVKERNAASKNVAFKVGQLFLHKRYNYEGIIIGWDTACDAAEEWIQHMGVDRLSKGRHQSFYHVLVCDKSVRYVAEENITIVDSSVQPSHAMMRLAGRHFKRWDADNHIFTSNVRDEYPED